MPLPPYEYPFDATGVALSNKLINEQHVVVPPPVQSKDANFIVPNAAPFFKTGLIIRTGPNLNDPVLVEGIDYILTHPFIEATFYLNKLIFGSILFLDRQFSGNVYITYNTLGGAFTLDDYSIVRQLTNSLYNILTVGWTQIAGLPQAFPPIPHDHTQTTDMVGLSEVVQQLMLLVTAAQAGAGSLAALNTSFMQHLLAVNAHTKAQVGLHLAPNYPPANQADLQTQSNSALMTPFMTLKMIAMYSMSYNPQGNGISDDDKADKTTQIVGGGLATGGGTLAADRTITVPKANPSQVVAGTSDAVALTVASAIHLLTWWKNVAFEPVDETQTPIVDINNVFQPGVYYLDIDWLNDPVNNGKVPTHAKRGGGCMLDVKEITTTSPIVTPRVVQTLTAYNDQTTSFSGQTYMRYGKPSDGTWTAWVANHDHTHVLLRGHVTVNNTVYTLDALNDNLLSIVKEADGYVGDYRQTAPQNNAYTILFEQPTESLDYTINATIAGGNNFNAIYNFVILNKTLLGFTFIVLGLSNAAAVSNTFNETQFTLELTVTGTSTLAKMN